MVEADQCEQDGLEVAPLPDGLREEIGKILPSYWSKGKIPICGTVLMTPKGARLSILEGTWEGYTAKSLDDDLSHFVGRVVMARDRDVVVNWWNLIPAGENESE